MQERNPFGQPARQSEVKQFTTSMSWRWHQLEWPNKCSSLYRQAGVDDDAEIVCALVNYDDDLLCDLLHDLLYDLLHDLLCDLLHDLLHDLLCDLLHDLLHDLLCDLLY